MNWTSRTRATLNPTITAEISAIRLELSRFEAMQDDAAVQFYCVTVDSNLAKALEGRDDAMLREVLAKAVDDLDDAVRATREIGTKGIAPAKAALRGYGRGVKT